MHELNSCNHLVGQHAHGFEWELSVTELEQILERLTEQLHNQGFVVAFDAIPEDFRDAG